MAVWIISTAWIELSLQVPNSERSQQHRADKNKGGADRQDIQFQGKVHIGLPSLHIVKLSDALIGSKQETPQYRKSAREAFQRLQ